MIFTTAWKIKLKISIGLCLIEREDYIEEREFLFMSVDNDYCVQLSVCNGVGMRKSEKTDYHRHSLESKDIEVAGAQYIWHSPKLLCMWAESDRSHSYAEHFPLQSRPAAAEMMSACNTQLKPRCNH